MERTRHECGALLRCLLYLALATVAAAAPVARGASVCRTIVLSGEVSAGQEWKQPFGEGWVFRLLPIAPGNAAYSGWDLVVDREQPVGYPDALLVATPPYFSINEREVGTTFGLRAQDALGWNPRSFHFLVKEAALRQAQEIYRSMAASGADRSSRQEPDARPAKAASALIGLVRAAPAGQFRILDAHIVPGTGDAVAYAQNWAMQAARTPHSVVQGQAASARGSLAWIRFETTLWLPGNWQVPKTANAANAACQ